jgi:uncharacterized protein
MLSTMQFPIQTFPDRRDYRFAYEISAEEGGLEDAEDEITFESPVRIEGEAFRQDDDVVMTLVVSVGATFTCGRCLDPVPATLNSRFQIQYRPVAERPAFLADEEEIGLGYYEAGIIDIREDIRRYLMLEVPLWPVCSEDCKGLCHRCGANLNHATCLCDQKKGDPRRRPLSEQLDRLLG